MSNLQQPAPAPTFPAGKGHDVFSAVEMDLALRTIMAYVSHEINNPLGTIANLAGSLARNVQRPNARSEEFFNDIQAIKAEVKNAAGIVRNARFGLGRRPTPSNALVVQELVLGVARRTEMLFSRERIAIEVECTDTTAMVRGDGELLEIALRNLMVNGVEASDGIEAGSNDVTVRVDVDDGMIDITIADTGPGFSEGVRERMFDPFFTTKPGRAGLGLAIAREVVNGHGGSIASVSRRDGGCFNVLLPALGRDT